MAFSLYVAFWVAFNTPLIHLSSLAPLNHLSWPWSQPTPIHLFKLIQAHLHLLIWSSKEVISGLSVKDVASACAFEKTTRHRETTSPLPTGDSRDSFFIFTPFAFITNTFFSRWNSVYFVVYFEVLLKVFFPSISTSYSVGVLTWSP